jgi:hypothetical protein
VGVAAVGELLAEGVEPGFARVGGGHGGSRWEGGAAKRQARSGGPVRIGGGNEGASAEAEAREKLRYRVGTVKP